MLKTKNIATKIEANLGFITINRPEVRNAIDQYTLDEIRLILNEWKTNDEVRCVVFTGAGEKSFAAGADIGKLKEKGMLDVFSPSSMQQLYEEIELYEKPTIALVNGYALGGGCELAMSCDIRLATENAKFGLPELNLAIIPGAGGTQRLSRIVGKGKALELILTGRIIDAKEAHRIGLVSDVFKQEETEEKLHEWTKQILAKGPLALKLAKLSVHYGFDADLKTGQYIEKLTQALLFGTEDKLEGTSAFLEKRKPQFRGK
jgi:enoyl-CoA hydratase